MFLWLRKLISPPKSKVVYWREVRLIDENEYTIANGVLTVYVDQYGKRSYEIVFDRKIDSYIDNC
jgi:hypothetical protein